MEAKESTGEIILYQADGATRLEVKLRNNTVWLTQGQMAELFGTKRPAITKHLANIFKSGELDEKSTCSILEHMGNDNLQHYQTKLYNLDAILSIGYRVNSINATKFRQWANKVLKDSPILNQSLKNRKNTTGKSTGRLRIWAEKSIFSSRPPDQSNRAFSSRGRSSTPTHFSSGSFKSRRRTSS